MNFLFFMLGDTSPSLNCSDAYARVTFKSVLVLYIQIKIILLGDGTRQQPLGGNDKLLLG